MIEENLARLRTYRNNIHRYRRLLATPLTDLERDFIARRMAEEHEAISEGVFPIELCQKPADSAGEGSHV